MISTKLSCAGPIMFVRYSETFTASLGDVSFKGLTHWIGGNRKRSIRTRIKIEINNILDCHLSPVGRQMAIENPVSNDF